MHVSYDKATTWKKTTSLKTYGERYLWDGLEFDPTSYDELFQISKDVYYSTPYAGSPCWSSQVSLQHATEQSMCQVRMQKRN